MDGGILGPDYSGNEEHFFNNALFVAGDVDIDSTSNGFSLDWHAGLGQNPWECWVDGGTDFEP